MTVLLAFSETGRPTPNPIPAYVGITDRLGEWRFASERSADGLGIG